MSQVDLPDHQPAPPKEPASERSKRLVVRSRPEFACGVQQVAVGAKANAPQVLNLCALPIGFCHDQKHPIRQRSATVGVKPVISGRGAESIRVPSDAIRHPTTWELPTESKGGVCHTMSHS